jgi:hypothetical protein
MVRISVNNDRVFRLDCELAGIQPPPSRRQENKFFKQKRGKAYAFKREAEATIEAEKFLKHP